MRRRRMALITGMVALGLTSGGLATAAQPPVVEAVAPAATPTFTDIGPGDAYYADVVWMVSAGIATGWPDKTFRPTAPVTREAAAAFLGRWWIGDPDIPPCNPADPRVFTDVGAGNPYCRAIEILQLIGAAEGYPDGTFRPAESVTREGFTALLLRTSGVSATCDAGPRTFTDVPAGHPFCGYIEHAADEGIVTGWPDKTFRPGLPIERQAFAAMLHRADGTSSKTVLEGARAAVAGLDGWSSQN